MSEIVVTHRKIVINCRDVFFPVPVLASPFDFRRQYISIEEKVCLAEKNCLAQSPRPKKKTLEGPTRKPRHAFLARTPTRKRYPHSTVYECLKAFFRL